MKLRVCWAVAAAAALAWAGGCNGDGEVLWRMPDVGGNSAGGVGGQGGQPSVGNGWPPPSSGAQLVGPGPGPGGGPDPLPCPDPMAPICECAAGQLCYCEPNPNSPAGEDCFVQCNEGECALECMPMITCNFDCAGGCNTTCHPDSSCEFFCGDGCTMTCFAGSVCTLWSWNGPSEMYCEDGALCNCLEGCSCFGPGCP